MKRFLFILAMLTMLLIPLTCAPEANAASFSGGSGTETDPYRISTAADLWEMAKKINNKKTMDDYSEACYRLTADIDLGGKKRWEPIGYHNYEDFYSFDGIFDGDGHTISGIRVQYKDPWFGQKHHVFGLFGQMEGTVKNLTIDGSSFSAEGQSIEIGAIAGMVWNGTVTNCHTTDSVTVSGSYKAGGICGNVGSDSMLSDCTNAADVSATALTGGAGGIASFVSSPVLRCSNSGDISAAEGEAAGIAVTASGGLTDCGNSGSITANRDAAGIVCNFNDGALNHSMNDENVKLLRCTNSGEVASATSPAGGIAAGCRTGSVVDCVNSGTVKSPRETGGIFAYFQNSSFGAPCKVFTVSGCENSGMVFSLENYAAGGICGMIYGNSATRLVFENCTNSGSVEAVGQKDVLVSGAEAGGVIGEGSAWTLEVRECRNSGAVRGYASAGGVIGSISPVRDTEDTLLLVAECENSGDIFTVYSGGLTQETYAGGIVGYCAVDMEDGELLPIFDDVQIEKCRHTGTLGGDRETEILCTDDLCASWQSKLW